MYSAEVRLITDILRLNWKKPELWLEPSIKNKSDCHIKNSAEHMIKGYQQFDRVLLNGTEYFIPGRRVPDYFDLRKPDDIKIHTSAKAKELTLPETAEIFLTELKKNTVTGYCQNRETFQGADPAP